jgi:hypothetical protein
VAAKKLRTRKLRKPETGNRKPETKNMKTPDRVEKSKKHENSGSHAWKNQKTRKTPEAKNTKTPENYIRKNWTRKIFFTF